MYSLERNCGATQIRIFGPSFCFFFPVEWKSKLKEQIIIMTMSVWNFISRNEQMHYCDEAFPPFVITSSAQWLKRSKKFINQKLSRCIFSTCNYFHCTVVEEVTKIHNLKLSRCIFSKCNHFHWTVVEEVTKIHRL